MSWRPLRSWWTRIFLVVAAGLAVLLGTACTTGAGGTLYRLRMCETGGHYRENSVPGYSGAYGFNNYYWKAMGYPGLPYQASPALQDTVASRLLANPGARSAFPACSVKLGLR